MNEIKTEEKEIKKDKLFTFITSKYDTCKNLNISVFEKIIKLLESKNLISVDKDNNLKYNLNDSDSSSDSSDDSEDESENESDNKSEKKNKIDSITINVVRNIKNSEKELKNILNNNTAINN